MAVNLGPLSLWRDIGSKDDSDEERKRKESGMTKEYFETIWEKYKERFDRTMPGIIKDRVKTDRATADMFWALLQKPTAELMAETDPDKIKQYQNWGFFTEFEKYNYDDKIAKEKQDVIDKEPKKLTDDPLYKTGLSKLDAALSGGIIDQATYDKLKPILDTGQFDVVGTELNKATTTFLRGDIDEGAPDLGTFETPEFKPEDIQKWYDQLSQFEAPLEAETIKKTQDYYNAVNPYTTGSGSEIKATNEQIARMISERYGKAMGIGQQEYETKYNKALQDFDNKHADYWKRIGRDWSQEDYAKQRTDYETDLSTRRTQDRSDMSTAYERSVADSYRGRSWQNQDYTRSAGLAEKMAKMSRPADKGWEQYLQPILTCAGYALGGPVGAGIGTLFTKKT